jgi:hypothetical protein
LSVDFYVYIGRNERKRGAKKEYVEALPKSTYHENEEKNRHVSDSKQTKNELNETDHIIVVICCCCCCLLLFQQMCSVFDGL